MPLAPMLQSLPYAPQLSGSEGIQTMNPRVIVRLAFGCLLTTPIPAAADPSTASLEQIGSGATARWTELGKRGEAHIACGSDCIEHG